MTRARSGWDAHGDPEAFDGGGWIECATGRECPGDYPLPHGLCAMCVHDAGRDIGLLPYDYLDLEQILPPAKGATEYVSGTRELRAGISLWVDEIQREILSVLVASEDAVREVCGMTPRVLRVRAGRAVQNASCVVAVHVETLACEPEVHVGLGDATTGVGAILRLTAAHRRARHALGLTRLTTQLREPCADCGKPTVYRENGSDQVFCKTCRATKSYDEWLDHVAYRKGDYGGR